MSISSEENDALLPIRIDCYTLNRISKIKLILSSFILAIFTFPLHKKRSETMVSREQTSAIITLRLEDLIILINETTFFHFVALLNLFSATFDRDFMQEKDKRAVQ